VRVLIIEWGGVTGLNLGHATEKTVVECSYTAL